MAGRWGRYADNTGIWIGDLLNRNMRETLKAGIYVLVANTNMDSGRAASHWVVIPNRGNVRPGSWKQMTFNPAYGTSPVGKPGDKGRHRLEVIKAVVQREWARSIDKAIRGRSPATVFEFHSSVPPYYDDHLDEEVGPTEGQKSYWENAKLEEAKQAALDRMTQKFNALMVAGKARKRPLR